MYKPCQRPSYRHVPPPLSPLAPIPSSLRSRAHPQIAPPPLSCLLSLSHTRKPANHATGDPSPRPRFAAAQLLSRRPVSENSGAAEPEFESPSNPPAVLPPPPPAHGALLQPENTVAPEKVPLWHCSRSARWYAFRVFFFFWGGGKKVEAKIQFTLDNHAVEWVLISSSCYSVRNLLMFVQFLELISWYSLQLMNASLFLELIS